MVIVTDEMLEQGVVSSLNFTSDVDKLAEGIFATSISASRLRSQLRLLLKELPEFAALFVVFVLFDTSAL